jgi:hypothetical protein
VKNLRKWLGIALMGAPIVIAGGAAALKKE